LWTLDGKAFASGKNFWGGEQWGGGGGERRSAKKRNAGANQTTDPLGGNLHRGRRKINKTREGPGPQKERGREPTLWFRKLMLCGGNKS